MAAVHHAGSVDAAHAFELGAAFASRVRDARNDAVALFGCGLLGERTCLGRHQHAPHALVAETPSARRITGGTHVRAATGLAYVALGLRDASALMPCPPGRILNRNVRGALTGLTRHGAPALYFGRDWISVQNRPVAWVGWDEAEDGTVCVELVIGVQTSFAVARPPSAYPEHPEPSDRGRAAITLGEAWNHTVEPEEAVELVFDGYARKHGLTVDRVDASQALSAAPDEGDEGLSFGPPRPIPSGFLAAGARLDGGRIARARLVGDFCVSRASLHAFERALRGVAHDSLAVGAVVDAHFGPRAGASIEAITRLASVRDAVLEAARD